MAIVRWDPATELGTLHGEVNRLFNGVFGPGAGNGAGAGGARRWMPAMDLFETGSHFVARLDLPGMDEDGIDVEVEDNVLRISGERIPEQRDSARGWYRFERAHGTFTRELQLPDGVDVEAIEAAFDRGVLELRIPRPAKRTPRKVNIGRGGSSAQAIEGRDVQADDA